MELTALQIIDTAVKVGLGALISGFATFFVTRASHKEQRRREHSDRKSDLLEGVARQVETATHLALDHWTFVAALKEKDVSDQLVSKLLESRSHLRESFKELSSAEGVLLLLGQNEAQTLLREYGEFMGEYVFNLVPKLDSMEAEQVRSVRLDLLQKRRDFFAALSGAYVPQGI